MTVIQLLALCRCFKMLGFKKTCLVIKTILVSCIPMEKVKALNVYSSFLRVVVCVKCCACQAWSEFLVADSGAVPVCLMIVWL